MTHAFLKSASVAPPQFCGKIAFDTRQHARRAAARTVPTKDNIKQHSTFGKIGAYKCRHCGCYHVGHA